MIPRRFRLLRPYLASFIHSRFERPPASEMMEWVLRPDKAKRAMEYVDRMDTKGGFHEVVLKGRPETFYYPEKANWLDLCQTIDEVYNPRNWHHFVSAETPIGPDDVVVDCGAAEGLFSFMAATRSAKVYAIEPIPSWHDAMDRTFAQFANVEVMRVGVGHRDATMRMTDNEIYSRVSSSGNLEIPIRTLDTLFVEKGIPVTFIKADIEGFEFPMLLGAEDLIRARRPKLSITVYHGPNNVAEMRDFLKNIHDDYRFKVRGMAENGNPVLLQVY